MIIARQKKKENIAEYILYMWQVEDLIRAYNFDLDKINQAIVSQFEETYDVKREILEWYENLIKKMKKEGIGKSGHLSSTTRVVNELTRLHEDLVNEYKDQTYIELYSNAKESLADLQERSGGKWENEIETGLNGLYAYLLLKLKQVDISKETMEAMDAISSMIAYLAQKYKEHRAQEV